MYIQNRRNSSKFYGCSPLQNCNGLISLKPAIAYFAYTQRYGLYKLKIQKYIFLVFLLLSANMVAQVKYDTIPSDIVVSTGFAFDELFIFKDFRTQALNYFENIDFETLDCYGEIVFIESIFGENGKLKNTRIVKSA